MKKTTSRLSSLLLALTVALGSLLLTTSCSDDGLLKSIPADVDIVASINFTRMADELDIEIGENTLSGPADMKVEFQSIPADVRDFICGLNGAIDASCVMAFGNLSVNSSEMPFYLLARVTDSDRLQQLLAKSTDFEKQTIDGFDVYSDYTFFMLATDDCLWILPQQPSAQSAVSNVKNLLDRAKKKSIAKLDHVAKRLNNENVINMVMNLDPMVDFVSNNAYAFLDTQQAMMASAMLPMLKGHWMELTFDLDDNTFTLTTSAFKPETGDTVDYMYDLMSGNIDDDLLEYLPANTSMVYAANFNSRAVQQLITGLSAFTGGNPILSPLMKALSKVDGTIAIGLGSDLTGSTSANPSSNDVNLFAAMQFTDGGANEFKSQIANMMSTFGDARATETGAMTSITIGKNSFNLIAHDDNLFLTTSPTLEAKSNIFSKDMGDYPAAFEFFTPNMGELTSGRCHMQLKAMLTFKEGIAKLTVSLDKLQGSLLSELYKAIGGLNDAMNRRYPQMTETTPDAEESYYLRNSHDSLAYDELLDSLDD